MQSPPKAQQTKPPLKSKCNPEACVPSAASPDNAKLSPSGSAPPPPPPVPGQPGLAAGSPPRRGCSITFPPPPALAPLAAACAPGWAPTTITFLTRCPLPGPSLGQPPSAAGRRDRADPPTDTARAGLSQGPGQPAGMLRPLERGKGSPAPTQGQPAQDFTLKSDMM